MNKSAFIYLFFAACFFIACNTKENKVEAGDEKVVNANRVFVLIKIQAAKGKEEITRKTFVNTIKTSHKPGMVSAQIFEDSKDPSLFYSLQEWENEAAFKQHMHDADNGAKSATATILKGEPELSLLRLLN